MASKKSYLEGATDLDKLHDLCKRTHKEQAVWFLNAFWEDFASAEAEKLWGFVSILASIDKAKENGSELDEMEAHRFLEKADEAHTVLEMRARLRNTGAIGANERPKTVPLSHYLLFKYDSQNPNLFHELVTRAQGDNQKQIEEAQAKLDAVSRAFEEASRAANAAAASLKEALAREAAAKSAEDDARAKEAEAKSREAAAKKAEGEAHASADAAKKAEEHAHASADAAKVKEAEAHKSAETLAVREEEVRKSQAELEAALAEVKKQEDAYNAKTESLKQKSEDPNVGVVSRNKAKNELAQHLAEDPLPLRQAKITAEAAVRKAEKATKAAADAKEVAVADAAKASEARAHAVESRAAAEAARGQAESARAAAEADKDAADAAVDAAQAAVAEAEAYLEEQKSKPGSSHGSLWWMDRELHEKKKYMPMRKGGISK